FRSRATPEVVFEYFTDPAKMVQWVGTDAALDARPGGSFRISVLPQTDVARGEFLEIDRPRRIVMSWGWESGPITPGSTRVEVDFVPDGDGTIVRLRHLGLDEAGRTSHGE